MTTDPLEAVPIAPFAPVAPDGDWEASRQRIAAELESTALPAWTDRNAADPGVTLAEAAAFGLADLHYRLAEADHGAWPLAWRGWVTADQRHWSAAIPVERPASPAPAPVLVPLADALAAAASVPGESLERRIRACVSRSDADAVVGRAPFAAVVPASIRGAVVALMRDRLVRQMALEHADVVADAVAAADQAGGTGVERDAAAAASLTDRLPLWTSEIAALVRRERRRLGVEAVAARSAAIDAASTPAEVATVRAALAADGLDMPSATVAAARPRVPVGVSPEDLEDPRGWTQVWPPHPIQALTCEPVIAQDYARRARTHPLVRRAWAVPGRLAGIAWNGLPTPDPATLAPGNSAHAWAVDPGAVAVTIVVDRIPAPGGDEPADTYLRRVLVHAIGTEASHPFPSWRDSTDALDPRRLLADEVGIALLRTVDVRVRATLVIPATADKEAAVAAAAARVAGFLAAGRPETAIEAVDDPLAGPWPPAPQPEGGWVPGEPIRFTEVVEALVGVDDVIAVRDVHLSMAPAGPWRPSSEGEFALPEGSIPRLAGDDCLTTEFATAGGC